MAAGARILQVNLSLGKISVLPGEETLPITVRNFSQQRKPLAAKLAQIDPAALATNARGNLVIADRSTE